MTLTAAWWTDASIPWPRDGLIIIIFVPIFKKRLLVWCRFFFSLVGMLWSSSLTHHCSLPWVFGIINFKLTACPSSCSTDAYDSQPLFPHVHPSAQAREGDAYYYYFDRFSYILCFYPHLGAACWNPDRRLLAVAAYISLFWPHRVSELATQNPATKPRYAVRFRCARWPHFVSCFFILSGSSRRFLPLQLRVKPFRDALISNCDGVSLSRGPAETSKRQTRREWPQSHFVLGIAFPLSTPFFCCFQAVCPAARADGSCRFPLHFATAHPARCQGLFLFQFIQKLKNLLYCYVRPERVFRHLLFCVGLADGLRWEKGARHERPGASRNAGRCVPWRDRASWVTRQRDSSRIQCCAWRCDHVRVYVCLTISCFVCVPTSST